MTLSMDLALESLLLTLNSLLPIGIGLFLILNIVSLARNKPYLQKRARRHIIYRQIVEQHLANHAHATLIFEAIHKSIITIIIEIVITTKIMLIHAKVDETNLQRNRNLHNPFSQTFAESKKNKQTKNRTKKQNKKTPDTCAGCCATSIKNHHETLRMTFIDSWPADISFTL